MSTSVCLSVLCISVQVSLLVCLCICIVMCVYLSIFMSMCMYLYVCVHICVYVYIYIIYVYICKCLFVSVFLCISRIRRNLFIHKARIPARRFSSSMYQHFKMFPPFASNEGYSASGLRYQSDGVRVTHPLPHSEFTRICERTCDLTLALSHSPFAYYSYISLYSHLFLTSTVNF